MIHKKYFFIAALLAMNSAYGMDPHDGNESDGEGSVGGSEGSSDCGVREPADRQSLINSALALCVQEFQNTPPHEDLMDMNAEMAAEDVLSEKILIVGNNVHATLTELEKMSPDEFRREQIRRLVRNSRRTEADFRVAKLNRGTLVESGAKRLVWRDDGYNGTATLTTKDYLEQAHDEIRIPCIAHIANFWRYQETVSRVHVRAPVRAAALLRSALVLRDEDMQSFQLGHHIANIMSVGIVAELLERILLERFGVEVPNRSIDYEAHAARTKEMLETLSQQQT